MGRTNPTYRDRLRTREQAWSDYRRGLRQHDQVHFDELWEAARAHADASGLHNPGDPITTILFSICLEQQKAISSLEDRVTELQSPEGDVQS